MSTPGAALRRVDIRDARRLAVIAQRLAGPTPAPTPASILAAVRHMGCLQLDPTRAVERNHLLLLWSRFGAFDEADLDQLRWEDRVLFDYWAHAASIVLTEDLPLHARRMREYRRGDSWGQRMRTWMEENAALRRHVLRELERNGPLRGRDLTDVSVKGWVSSGWTNERNVSRMLEFLWMQGKVLISRREGGQRWWDLAERVLLPEVLRQPVLPEREAVARSAVRSLRALGVATDRHIAGHFVPGRFPGLDAVLRGFERDGIIERIEVVDDGAALPGNWFIHAEDIATLEDLDDAWQPRTTLLSPFDNLIRDRVRTALLFGGFDFRLEIYTPAAKRKYGFFVMPLLHGDQLVGRLDPKFERERGALVINAVHLEPGVRRTRELTAAMRRAAADLADWLGATEVVWA